MAIPFLNDVDLHQNELQNAVLQNLATAPLSPIAGQMYFNTADKLVYTFDGTNWITGKAYTAGNGITITNGEIAVDEAVVALKSDLTDFITLTDLSATGPVLYNNTTGVISADFDSAPTANSTKFVNSGVVHQAIEDAVADKIELTDLSATGPILYDNTTGVISGDFDNAPTASSNKMVKSGAVYQAIEDAVADKIELTDLSIAAGSVNYLEYNSANGEFGAKVDTAVTANSTNLVTSGAVKSAIDAAITGGVHYAGTWDITSATDFSGITLPQTKGALFYVVGSGPKEIGGIEWNAGDYLLVNADVEAGGSLDGKVEKIDNTESADIVRLNATQTLTNKTISANNNTIADLAVANFASGVVQTAVRADGTAVDTALVTEKAVRDAVDDAVDGMVTVDGVQTLTNKTIDADNNTVSNLELDNFKTGVVRTDVRAVASAVDTAVVTEKAVATGLAAKTEKFTATNVALTPAAGVCTWTITNEIGSADVLVQIFRVADNVQVMAEVAVAAASVTVKMNSAAEIAAGTYKAVVIGL